MLIELRRGIVFQSIQMMEFFLKISIILKSWQSC